MKHIVFLFASFYFLLFSCNDSSRKDVRVEPLDNSKDKVIVVNKKIGELEKEFAFHSSLPDNKKKGYKANLRKIALENVNFRKVMYSNKHLQLVLMSLKPNEEIGEETHLGNDQFFCFEKGRGKVTINGNEYYVVGGDAIIIPAGAKHNIKNISNKKEFKMFTIYSPPQHKDGIVRLTKALAHKNENKFDGVTSE